MLNFLVISNTKRKLRELAYKGLYELAKKYGYIANDIKHYEQRLAYELNIINYKILPIICLLFVNILIGPIITV